MSVETTSAGDTLRCARHPNVETVLRCGRCETPICPKCQIQTPVGARCPSCAQVRRFATVLKPREFALSTAYGVGAAAAGTIVFFFVPFLGPLISFALIGFGVGEAVAIGANRKRARELGFVAIACLVVGYVLGFALFAVLQGVATGPEILLAPLLALRQIQILIGILVGALLAWMRAR
jgi:hypothetical protein